MNGPNGLYTLPWPQSRLSPLSLHKYFWPQTKGWGTSLRKVAALHSGLCWLENGDRRYLLRKKQSFYSNVQHSKPSKEHKCTQFSRMDTKSKSLKSCRPGSFQSPKSLLIGLKPQPVCLIHTEVQVLNIWLAETPNLSDLYIHVSRFTRVWSSSSSFTSSSGGGGDFELHVWEKSKYNVTKVL